MKYKLKRVQKERILVQFSAKLKTKVQEKALKSQHHKSALFPNNSALSAKNSNPNCQDKL